LIEGPNEKEQVETRDSLMIALVEKLQVYYDDEILGALVDLVHDNDEDEYYLNLHGA